MKKEQPKTMTEFMLRLRETDRANLLLWLTERQNVVGREIRVDISQWNAGLLGTFVCEIKSWEPPQSGRYRI